MPRGCTARKARALTHREVITPRLRTFARGHAGEYHWRVPSKSVDPRVELGRRLAAYRHERKLTAEGLAAVADLDVSNVRTVEKGSNPTLMTILKLAGVLEVDLGELFAGLDPYALGEESRPTRVSDVDPRFWRPRDRTP